MKIPLPPRPRKRLGQNFLRDENVLRKIVDFINPLTDDLFVEIGAGTGALTSFLSQKVAHLTAIETDRDLIPYLEKIPGIHIIQDDALKVDLSGLYPEKSFRVAGNVPYYISTALLTALISQRERIRDMTLVFQDEVAKRITAEVSTRDYSRLSVLAQYYCRIQKGFKISRNCFFPKPEVDSRILRFAVRKEPGVDVPEFMTFLHQAFSQKRKKLRNNLLNHLSIHAIQLDPIFQELEIEENARPENLFPEQFEQLLLRLRKR